MKQPLFYLIGFNKNYTGGFSLEASIFQRFSFTGDDFKPSEHKKKIFNKLVLICEQTLKEHKLKNDISIEYWENEQGAILHSKNITTLICDFFKSQESYGQAGQLILDEYIFEDFERNNIESFSYQQKLSFLLGVFDSNGNDNTISFYNDYQKCILTHYTLKCFGDENDEIVMKSYFKTPFSDHITINKNGSIWRLLKSKMNA